MKKVNIILLIITLVCSFIPFKTLSIILSTYMKNTNGASNLIIGAASKLWYIARLNSLEKKKKTPVTHIQNKEAALKILLQTSFILL